MLRLVTHPDTVSNALQYSFAEIPLRAGIVNVCGVNRVGIKLLRVIYNSNKYTIVDFVFCFDSLTIEQSVNDVEMKNV